MLGEKKKVVDVVGQTDGTKKEGETVNVYEGGKGVVEGEVVVMESHDVL